MYFLSFINTYVYLTEGIMETLKDFIQDFKNMTIIGRIFILPIQIIFMLINIYLILPATFKGLDFMTELIYNTLDKITTIIYKKGI